MKRQDDLIGKTITGIMAVPTEEEGPLKIWMLQFSDGTHVEFVSPGARRTLDRLAGSGKRQGVRRGASPGLPGKMQGDSRSGQGSERSRRDRRDAGRSATSQAGVTTSGEAVERDVFVHPQLALNVA